MVQAAKERYRVIKMLFFPGLRVDATPLDRKEFWELIKIFFGAVTFVSVLIAILTFAFQESVVTREYNWRHMKEAQDILLEWDHRAGPSKASIESFFCRRHHWQSMQAITRDDALDLFNAFQPDDPYPKPNSPGERWNVRKDMITLLNYFETISTASQRGIADESILHESLGGPMVAWRGYLLEFTNMMDMKRKRPVWAPYYAIVEKWTYEPARAQTNGQKPSHERGSFERR